MERQPCRSCRRNMAGQTEECECKSNGAASATALSAPFIRYQNRQSSKSHPTTTCIALYGVALNCNSQAHLASLTACTYARAHTLTNTPSLRMLSSSLDNLQGGEQKPCPLQTGWNQEGDKKDARSVPVCSEDRSVEAPAGPREISCAVRVRMPSYEIQTRDRYRYAYSPRPPRLVAEAEEETEKRKP